MSGKIHPAYERILELRARGVRWKEIGRMLGRDYKYCQQIVQNHGLRPAKKDIPPDPFNGSFYHIPGETPEQRAFRRFPIDKHKPRYD